MMDSKLDIELLHHKFGENSVSKAEQVWARLQDCQ